ncbi:hypothetical protein D3C81_469520 [compost metagenome]
MAGQRCFTHARQVEYSLRTRCLQSCAFADHDEGVYRADVLRCQIVLGTDFDGATVEQTAIAANGIVARGECRSGNIQNGVVTDPHRSRGRQAGRQVGVIADAKVTTQHRDATAIGLQAAFQSDLGVAGQGDRLARIDTNVAALAKQQVGCGQYRACRQRETGALPQADQALARLILLQRWQPQRQGFIRIAATGQITCSHPIDLQQRHRHIDACTIGHHHTIATADAVTLEAGLEQLAVQGQERLHRQVTVPRGARRNAGAIGHHQHTIGDGTGDMVVGLLWDRQAGREHVAGDNIACRKIGDGRQGGACGQGLPGVHHRSAVGQLYRHRQQPRRLRGHRVDAVHRGPQRRRHRLATQHTRLHDAETDRNDLARLQHYIGRKTQRKIAFLARRQLLDRTGQLTANTHQRAVFDVERAAAFDTVAADGAIERKHTISLVLAGRQRDAAAPATDDTAINRNRGTGGHIDQTAFAQSDAATAAQHHLAAVDERQSGNGLRVLPLVVPKPACVQRHAIGDVDLALIACGSQRTDRPILPGITSGRVLHQHVAQTDAAATGSKIRVYRDIARVQRDTAASGDNERLIHAHPAQRMDVQRGELLCIEPGRIQRDMPGPACTTTRTNRDFIDNRTRTKA